MTLEEFLKVIKALGLDPSMTLEAAMAKIKGDPAPANADDAPPSSKDGGPPDSSAEPSMAAKDGGAPPAAPSEDDPKKDGPAGVVAAASRLLRITGAKDFIAAVDVVDTFRTSHLELETERQKLSAERTTLESAERRRGCIDLVTLGGHAPSTVWADDKSTTPKKYLSAMSIADFREYVADALKAKGGKVRALSAPTAGEAGAAPLTPEQARICAEMKCDPASFVKLQNQRDSAKAGGN